MSDDHKTITVIETENHEIMHPMVAAAMAQAPTPETLRELLRVQREWEEGEAKKAYTRALVGLHRDLPASIGRDKSVDFKNTHYKYSSLANVTNQVTSILSAHGFSKSWDPSTSQHSVTVTCRLTHQEGHSESCTISSPPDNSGSKGPSQAVASTITLLQRYTLLSILGIATADMEEPHGPRPTNNPGGIDSVLNLKAAAHIRAKLGGIHDAEEHVGSPVEKWTANDLDSLREWLRAKLSPKPVISDQEELEQEMAEDEKELSE